MKATQSGRPQRFITDGAKDVLVWLKAHGLSITEWCERNQLDRVEIQRILNGERQRVAVDSAVDIVDACDGDIDVRRFAHSRAVRKVLFERRSKQRKDSARNRAA